MSWNSFFISIVRARTFSCSHNNGGHKTLEQTMHCHSTYFESCKMIYLVSYGSYCCILHSTFRCLLLESHIDGTENGPLTYFEKQLALYIVCFHMNGLPIPKMWYRYLTNNRFACHVHIIPVPIPSLQIIISLFWMLMLLCNLVSRFYLSDVTDPSSNYRSSAKFAVECRVSHCWN